MFNNAELIEHMERLRKFGYRLTSNVPAAEDLVQSTILRAIEKKHLFKENSNLYGWLSKIMFNIFASKYRRKVKWETQYDPKDYIEKEAVNGNQHIKFELQDVENAMKYLSRDHREILILVCIKGYRYAEVSERLQIPIGTVRSRLSRARECLETKLNASNPMIKTKNMIIQKLAA